MSDVQTATRLARVVKLVDHGYAHDPLEVVLNRGAIHGLKEGDRFIVFGIGPHIIDPETGEDLGELEMVRGQGKVVHVQEKIATIRSTERSRTRPARRILRQALIGPSIEEEFEPETEVPFESVQLGDYAKPI